MTEERTPTPLRVVPFVPRVFNRLGVQRIEAVSPRGGLEAEAEGEYWIDTENEIVFVEWSPVTMRLTGKTSVSYAPDDETPQLRPGIRRVKDAVDVAQFIMRTSEGSRLTLALQLSRRDGDPFARREDIDAVTDALASAVVDEVPS